MPSISPITFPRSLLIIASRITASYPAKPTSTPTHDSLTRKAGISSYRAHRPASMPVIPIHQQIRTAAAPISALAGIIMRCRALNGDLKHRDGISSPFPARQRICESLPSFQASSPPPISGITTRMWKRIA